MKSICELLPLWVSCWNFVPTQTFMNKNNYIFLNAKKTVVFWLWKYKFCFELLYTTYKFLYIQDSTARLNFCQLLCIRPIFQTLVLHSIFPFCSVYEFLSHIFFYIAVCHFFTSLLYIQRINGIIGMISKNSTTLSSRNIVEAIDREYQRTQAE